MSDKKILEEKLRDTLRNMDSEELLYVWNEYTDRANYPDDRIYMMQELDEIYNGTDATEVLMRAFYGHDDFGTDKTDTEFNPNRDYFYYNGYGNLVSCEYLDWNKYANRYCCSIIDEDAIVDYMIDNKTGLCNDDLEEIISADEDED